MKYHRLGKVKNLTTNENMKLRKRDDKYIDVGLTKNGAQTNELLHRLVAKAFCKKTVWRNRSRSY